MPFTIELNDKAQKDLNDLDPPTRNWILEELRVLEEKPFFIDGRTKKKIKGYEKLYELKIPPYRVIYSIEEQRVIVKRIIHRKALYRSLRQL